MLKQLRRLLKDLFDFSEREINGFLLLLIAMTIYLIIAFNWSKLSPSSEYAIPPSEQAELDSLLAIMQKVEVKEEKYRRQKYTAANKKQRGEFRPAKKLFIFDPNTVSVEEWQILGVPEYIAERIDRYRQKVRFRYKTDLARIYDFDAKKYEELEPYIDLPEKVAYDKRERKKEKQPDKSREFRPAEALFTFDPNTITEEGWLKLGVPSFIAKRIQNFMAKGGGFRKPEDLAKIYDFDPKKYEELKPYIRIETPQTAERPSKPKKEYAALEPFDLNQVDTTTLKRVRGIGSGYAKRIVEMRKKLGGFHSVEQLKELYRFPPETYKRLATFAFIKETPSLRKININTADIETLKAHFYIRYHQAQAIVNYRKQHGMFSGIEDLKKIYALKSDFIKKIAPYLTF